MEIGAIEKSKKSLSPENKKMEIDKIRYKNIIKKHLLDLLLFLLIQISSSRAEKKHIIKKSIIQYFNSYMFKRLIPCCFSKFK
tara:strand:+ start:55 stop:303 length:249 start_codon:yes stop_codon:yes gene_type:complete